MTLKVLAPSYYNRLAAVREMVGSGGSLLNIGCGDGEYCRNLKSRFSFIAGLDIRNDDIFFAKEKGGTDTAYALASGTDMPFGNKSFSSAICIDVIEHIPDDRKVISEISRVMEKGSKLVISVPNADFPFTYDPINAFLGLFGRKLNIGMWSFGHLRLYKESDLRKMLELNRFSVVRVRFLNHYLSGLFENYLSSIFYRFLKSPGTKINKSGKARKEMLPPRPLILLVEMLLKFDRLFFGNSKKSIGIMIEAVKF